MFQKIAKHRANDASNDVHRPPLSVIEHDRAEDGGRGSSFPNSQCGIFQDMFSTTPPIFSLPPAPGFVRRDSAGTATNNGKEGAIRMSSVLEHDRAQDGGRGSSFPNSHCGMSQDMFAPTPPIFSLPPARRWIRLCWSLIRYAVSCALNLCTSSFLELWNLSTKRIL